MSSKELTEQEIVDAKQHQTRLLATRLILALRRPKKLAL